MMNKAISPKSILIIFYIISVSVIGLVFVPYYEVWGPERTISGYSYKFIFSSMNYNHFVNGYNPVYQIDIIKQMYIIGIITIVFVAFYMLFSQWEKEDKTR